METRVGDLEVSYTARGIPTYRLELWHDGLKKHRVIKGNDASIIQRKANLQAADWIEKWAVAERRAMFQQVLRNSKAHREAQKTAAAERTTEAQLELTALDGLLAHTLSVNDAIDWERLKDRTEFSEPAPQRQKVSGKPPLEPDQKTFNPVLGFFDRLFSSRKDRKIEEAQDKYSAARAKWSSQMAARTAEAQKLEQEYVAAVSTWQQRKEAYEATRNESNTSVERKRAAYSSGDADAILDYCDLVLSNSQYPDWMPKEWELEYNKETRTLIVEYSLPAFDDLPTLTEIRYVQSRDEFAEKHLPEAQSKKLYDSVLYQIVLRTVHELFEADVVRAIDAVVLNGFVTSVDRSTGHETTACILSLQARKDEFAAINLAQVDPKACFKTLKGVGSSKLHSLAPVAPIMQMRREDGRFVSAREVANTLDESVNLAAMDWEEFEHLIRELFEREFKTSGGEVRVTQASRDGGVDAIAFDPDPIRGGKIVIQAKRYTNTVGVAAVRDLYGTVHNEGATKGILVTTSDYGPDAYAFAKDKPLTLLNGANLLHLLGKHGTRAKIDIPEARRLLGL
jgi:restriction system protein